jgi:hypothetical protein
MFDLMKEIAIVRQLKSSGIAAHAQPVPLNRSARSLNLKPIRQSAISATTKVIEAPARELKCIAGAGAIQITETVKKLGEGAKGRPEVYRVEVDGKAMSVIHFASPSDIRQQLIKKFGNERIGTIQCLSQQARSSTHE